MSHHVVPTFRVEFHWFVLVLQVNLLCRLHQIRYKHEARELSTSQKPVFFREHSRNIWNYLYTNLQVQGCSMKGDITCCKIERDNRGRNRGRKSNWVWKRVKCGLDRLADVCDARRNLNLRGDRSWQKSCNSGFSTREVSDSDHRTYFSKVSLQNYS